MGRYLAQRKRRRPRHRDRQSPEPRHCTRPGRRGVQPDPALRNRRCGLRGHKLSANALGVALSDSKVHTGWVAGAGIEWMFAHAWSVKAEYLYRHFDSQTYFRTQLPPGIASDTLALNSVQVGINYHF